MARVIIVLDFEESEVRDVTDEDVYNYLTGLMEEGDLDYIVEE
jgi:DNA-binding phage protein